MRRIEFFKPIESAQPPQIELPKIMHFIWVGPHVMPKEAVILVSKWAKANPTFKMYIWIDFNQYYFSLKETKENTKNFILKQYEKVFKPYGVGVCLSQTNANSTNVSVILNDISIHNLAGEIESYEMYRLDPNWGAASDSLRYKLGVLFGGGYADCIDIGPGVTSLEKSGIFVPGNVHRLYLDHKPQEMEIEEADLENFDLEYPNNDFFITTKGNPELAAWCEEIKKKYFFDEKTDLQELLERAYGSSHKFYLTLHTTGGTLIANQLEGINPINIGKNTIKYIKIRNNNIIEIKPVRCTQYSVYRPEENKLSWLYTPITKFTNKEEAINRLKMIMEFEMSHFKILRLDDHAIQLACSLDISKNEAANLIIENILNKPDINYENIRVVQCTHQINESVEFCKKNDLLKKSYFDLSSEYCKYILHYATNINYLKKEILEGLDEDGTSYLNNNFSIEQVKVLLYQIIQTITLIESLVNLWIESQSAEINKFVPINSKRSFDIINICYKIFDKIIADKYIDNFNEKDKSIYTEFKNKSIRLIFVITNILQKLDAEDTNNNNIQRFTDLSFK